MNYVPESPKSEEHPQYRRFTVYMRGFLGWPFKRVFIGTSSILKDGELFISREGSCDSINYANVFYVNEVDIAQEEHSHP